MEVCGGDPVLRHGDRSNLWNTAVGRSSVLGRDLVAGSLRHLGCMPG